MINPVVCPETSASLWASFSWQTFGWFSDIKLVLTALLSLTVLPWLIKLPFRRWISGFSLALLALYFIAASPTVTALGLQGLTLPLAAPQTTSADAIVVLGRGANLQTARLETAFSLWQSGYAPRIFISGRVDAPQMVQKLRAMGVPERAVDGEPCSSTTEENAQYSASILQPQGVSRIALVTDGPHMLRSLLTFHSLGFDVTPYKTPLPNTLGQSRSKFLIAREYLGLASYGALGRFFPRTVASMPAVPTDISASPDSDALLKSIFDSAAAPRS